LTPEFRFENPFPRNIPVGEIHWGIKFWALEFRFENHSPGISRGKSRGIDLTLEFHLWEEQLDRENDCKGTEEGGEC